MMYNGVHPDLQSGLSNIIRIIDNENKENQFFRCFVSSGFIYENIKRVGAILRLAYGSIARMSPDIDIGIDGHRHWHRTVLIPAINTGV